MGHNVTLDISDDIYTTLQKIAEETGRTPEEIIVQWLKRDVAQVGNDPLEKWIGAFDSGLPDLGTRHHEYIGQSLLDEMNNKDEAQS